ncbi:ribosomal large subunit pseudouridine synthase D [Desulfobotulus alkaliphilus]|uniref:Pseudouridine synthase n=1 Tax=Desulfobotulus alkaliphilus TaxID=622671 RepID=A0A562RXX2_9BACT|nr:RluA family pseudouridine synthase [Desulfobotulus alkaliphilus]TWI73256.1 ribosomal large subunit pseudouridine synthase D [Desulfobotulus alkaliphilus]
MDTENAGVFCCEVSSTHDGKRLDVFLAEAIDSLSRSLAVRQVKDGFFLVDGKRVRPSVKLRAGQQVTGRIPDMRPSPLCAQNLVLDILHEDAHLLVLNKAAGMVVHPAPGHPDGTLVNALLHHCPDLGGIGGEVRPGIVHRLDKDTSGVMVVAKHQLSHERLVSMFHDRKTEKYYEALVWGELAGDEGCMDAAIGRHPVDRKKMAALVSGGRQALSLWSVTGRYQGLTRLLLNIKTGRTHQIRVHCSHAGHPIVGDTLYGSRRPGERMKDTRMRAALLKVERQMLHARFLRFTHPVTGAAMAFEAPLPEDMENLLAYLRPWCTEERGDYGGSF